MPEPSVEVLPVAAPTRAGRRAAGAGHVATALPVRVVPSATIARCLDVTEAWVLSRTHVRHRHVAGPGERLFDLAARAGAGALDRAGLDPDELDLVLVATMSADDISPNAAPLVAHAIGARRAGAIDVGAACTGFLSALALGCAQVEAGRAEHVLVVGADVMSRITDPTDRRTAALFGDGAGALLLSSADEGPGGFGPFVLGSDATGADHIVCRHGGFMEMNGAETYRHAVKRLTEVVHQATGAVGWTLDDADLFVLHQANGRITAAVAERLGAPADRVVDCIADLGNTSAATLPLALAAAEADGRLGPGARVVLAAFGTGFTWGGVACTWGGRA